MTACFAVRYFVRVMKATCRLAALCLFVSALVFLACSADSGQALARDTGRQLEGDRTPAPEPNGSKWPDTGAVLCYRDNAVFMVFPPQGWVNDSAAAASKGVCAIYVPEGSSYHDAPAVLYPNVGAAMADTLNESADIQAEWIRGKLAEHAGGAGPKVRAGNAMRTEKGQEVAIRFYDSGPSPNEWEAAAYMQHNRQLFMLVLSARDRAGRDSAMRQLEEAARQVIALDFDDRRAPER